MGLSAANEYPRVQVEEIYEPHNNLANIFRLVKDE